MTLGVTPRQKQALDFIRAYVRQHDGASPSYREMQAGLHLASVSSVSRLLHGLERRGHIVRVPNGERSIALVEAEGTLKVRLRPDTQREVEGIAAAEGVSAAVIVERAVRGYLALTRHQRSAA
jgi:SOS-response transcriptional repressor LexA